MNKLLRIAVTLLLLTVPLIAQTQDMTSEQQKAFNQQSLYIDAAALIVSPWLLFMNPTHIWTARQGYQPISEAALYSIAGHPEEAKKASIHKTIGWSLLLGGAAMVVGGSIWMIAGQPSDYSDPDYMSKLQTALYGGMVVSLVGVIPLYIGIGKVRSNWSSVQQASILTEEYNKGLAESIRNQ